MVVHSASKQASKQATLHSPSHCSWCYQARQRYTGAGDHHTAMPEYTLPLFYSHARGCKTQLCQTKAPQLPCRPQHEAASLWLGLDTQKLAAQLLDPAGTLCRQTYNKPKARPSQQLPCVMCAVVYGPKQTCAALHRSLLITFCSNLGLVEAWKHTPGLNQAQTTTQHTQAAVSPHPNINTPAPVPQQDTLWQTLMHPQAACSFDSGRCRTLTRQSCVLSSNKYMKRPSHISQHSCLITTIQAVDLTSSQGLQPTTVNNPVRSRLTQPQP